MEFRIYYDNGQIYTSEDGYFEEAPLDGVLFILEKVNDRIITHSGADYYVQVDDSIVATGDLGPILRKLGWIKHGRWTSVKRYEDVGRQVARDASEWARNGS